MREWEAEGVGAGIALCRVPLSVAPTYSNSLAKMLPSVVVLAGITLLIWWVARRKRASLTMDEYSDYCSTQIKNRKIFQQNFGSDIRAFKVRLSKLRDIWARVGTTRGISGHSHVGLLPFSNILVRHVIFGFEHLACYQSFLAWLAFRPGLEALLIMGKFVDNPANATIWKNREVDAKAYSQTFSGRALTSTSLPRSADFRQVLTRLNDEFMHPNPTFAYRDATTKSDSAGVLLEIQFFDTTPEVHEGHLLAYVNLLDLIVATSDTLVSGLCGSTGAVTTESYAVSERNRAIQLAQNGVATKVMEELGLWKL